MGAGASTPESFFAFQVVQQEYDLLSKSSNISQHDLQLHLENLFNTAKQEYFFQSPLECTEPSCILIKLKLFEPQADAKNFCRTTISSALAMREKSKPKIVKSDYSKGFSGSLADTKAEKDFEKMMRGGEEEDDGYAILKPPRILFPEQKVSLEDAGSWCKELAVSGCYMYCHSLTRQIVSSRPDGYEDEVEDKSSHNEKEGGKEVDPANGLLSCHIFDLPKTLESLVKGGETKTPLILDNTEGSHCLTFFSMKAMLEDVSTLVVPYSVSGIKREAVMEKCRTRLVGAIKSGSTFVLYLGAVHIEHADFKKKLCKKDSFPAELFQQRGQVLLTPKSKPKYKLILREADMEAGLGDVHARDGFQVLVVSTLSPFEYEEKLKDCIPLGYMLPIFVHN